MILTPAEWTVVERVLDEVEALAEPDRGPALARLCEGSPAIRHTVERMIEADRECEEEGFLEEPAAALVAPALVAPATGTDPAMIGPFQIVREVGRGGYGRVFLAERDGGGQRVAVKVLRSGAGRRGQRRFRREQRLLASLHHPGIPRLIDSGRTAGGEEFLAMEYVEGEDILAYVRRRSPSLQERLRLFLQACEAVRYAHARLVVHRDIKPQNVLVTEVDGRPAVKVVDFGIAKPLEQSTDRITRTGPRAPMTIAYAAPEQIAGAPADPTTDVYALGLLLFLLLAERPPFDLKGKSRREVERTLLEESVPRPSSIVEAPWARRLRGDLDHVVLKALEKVPARRYRTADALYADIERFLDGVPVSARRPSLLYAAWRFAWRRRAAVLGTAATIAAAAITHAAGVSRERAAELRAAEERAVVAEVLADVLGAMEGAPGSAPSADALLRGATRAITGHLGPRPEVEAELLTLVAQQYESLGRHREAIPLYERAVTIETRLRPGHPAHTDAVAGLGASLGVRHSYTSEIDYARSDSLLRLAWRQAVSTYGAGSPRAASLLCTLGRTHYYRGNYGQAAGLCRRALELIEEAAGDSLHWAQVERSVMLRLNPWLWHTSWNARGERTAERRYAIMNTLGYAEMSLGNYWRSIHLLTEAANGLLRTHPYQYGTAATYEALGSAYDYVNRHHEAEEAYNRALVLMRIVAGDSSVAVARVLGHIVGPQFFSGNLRGALRTVEEAVAIAEVTRDTVEIIAQLYALGYVTRRLGDARRAHDALTRALRLIQSSSSTEPDLEMTRIMAHAERSACRLSLGDQGAAEAEAAYSYRLARRARRFNVLGQAAVAYAEALAARGEHAEAIAVLAPAYQTLWDPPIRTNRRLLAERIARCLATSYAAIGDHRAASLYTIRASRHQRPPPDSMPD